MEKLLAALRAGAYRIDACRAAGIHYNTLLAWEKKGEASRSGEYVEFLEALRMAEAEAAITNVGVITTAAQNGDWRAAAWFLEHRYPELWARLEKRQLALLQANMRAELEAEMRATEWEKIKEGQDELYELVTTNASVKEHVYAIIEAAYRKSGQAGVDRLLGEDSEQG
jgi:broad-specificity NMP kinase